MLTLNVRYPSYERTLYVLLLVALITVVACNEADNPSASRPTDEPLGSGFFIGTPPASGIAFTYVDIAEADVVWDGGLLLPSVLPPGVFEAESATLHYKDGDLVCVSATFGVGIIGSGTSSLLRVEQCGEPVDLTSVAGIEEISGVDVAVGRGAIGNSVLHFARWNHLEQGIEVTLQGDTTAEPSVMRQDLLLVVESMIGMADP